MNVIKKFFKDILTEISGEYDAARVSLIIALLSFIAYAFSGLFYGHNFDLISYGVAITGIIAGGTAGVGLRAKLEDGTSDKNKTETEINIKTTNNSESENDNDNDNNNK